ncbi:DCK1 [Candida metapsilosis]|uniref:DCK1 n=1 Tax=Candida metapsilosis TaxID=273372 RepID=A0A8H7ZEA1_9ASCO|nr:DCK1 [Candida metapsilosis]
MTWARTNSFLKGRVLKPFLPNERHPQLRSPHFKNLYPGDQVFIFDIKDNKWARGYAVVKPWPSEYIATSCNLDELPVQDVQVVIFPLEFVKITGELPYPELEVNEEFNNIVDASAVPTIADSEKDHKEATNGVQEDSTPRIPPFPNSYNEVEDLGDEIKYTLELLTSHIFALYSMGEFRLFTKLVSIYHSLNETRIKLSYDLLTEDEARVAKETVVFFFNKIPKLLASKTARIDSKAYDLENDGTDVSGYKSILARDAYSGRVLNWRNSNPALIALNSELGALDQNFPIKIHNYVEKYSLTPPLSKNFRHEPPSHILVDFKSVSGSSAYQPPGFAGTIAYMYLRNSHKRLTEAFAVHTDSVDDLVNVEKISAALFRNVPSSEIVNNKVFLVTVLTEEVDLSLKNTQAPHVRRVKRGIAAGVADITRIFSRNTGSLQSGEAHHFSIKLYGSYMNKRGDSADGNQNNGWGELVDRIIAGTSHGIAVNPRAEKLVVTVKEFKHQFSTSSSDMISGSTPIARIKPIFFDPLAENYERIYLRMDKVHLIKGGSKDDLLTFEISTPNNELITFAKASNQLEKKQWQFISVFSGECIGEIVKVNGVSLKSPTKKSLRDDFILLSFYVNGILAGEGKLLYKSGNRLVEFNKTKPHVVEILSTSQQAPIARVEVNTEYVGKVYNSDISIDNVFQYEKYFKLGQKGLDELSNSLVVFCKLELPQLLKYFSELLSSLLGIVQGASHNTGSTIEILEDNTFKAITHLLDTLFGKQEEYFHLIDDFMAKHRYSEQVGLFLINKVSEIFGRATVNWNAVARSMCRVNSVLLRIALKTLQDTSELDATLNALNGLFLSVEKFLSVDSSALVDDQVLVLESLDYLISLKSRMDDRDIMDMSIKFIDSIGLRGMGADELNYDGTVKKATKDHKIPISKLLLILRLLNGPLAENDDIRHVMLAKSIQWAVDVFLGPMDVDATRLGCSVLNRICTILWEKSLPLGKDLDLCFSLAKFLPAMARTFIRYNKFTRGNGYFKPKRILTQLFPTTHPFNSFTIDQAVNDESLVEVLVELAACFAFMSKIGKAAAGNEGFGRILNTKIEGDFFDPAKYLAADFHGEDLLTIISGIRYIRLGKYFPEDKWLSLYAIIVDGSMCALELIRPLIVSYQLPPIEESEHFDRVLWGNYLKALLKLAVLPPVAVEHLSTVPGKACSEITHDVRDRAAYLINEAWDSLAWNATESDVIRFNLNKFGGYQVEFIDDEFSLVSELILFGLQRNDECQSVSVKMIWSIMVSEFILSGELREIEKQCLIGLYEVFQKASYKPTKQDQDNFIKRMKATIRLDREDEAFGIFYDFIQNLTAFCTTLNYYASVPVPPEFDEDRRFHNIKLRAQIKAAGKPEYFNSFIGTMYDDYVKVNDFVQAALSLELLAATYTWDHKEIVPASYRPKFPKQTSFERKELLYKMMATNFIKGKSLEKAADVFNELLDAYHEHTYDLKSFAYVHNKLAQLYLDLESSDKLEPSYFRVEAIGTGFPYYMRVISQIYQGLPFEHITSIHERLLKVFPGAIMINDDAEAQKLRDDNATGRYLLVKAVEPVFEFSDKLFGTSFGVRQYARNKDLRFFRSVTKIPGSTSVFDLWTDQTTYESWLSFPTLMNRSFIKSSETVRLSPLDNAIQTITKKNDDLILLENLINTAIKEKTDYSTHFSDLSRQLSGTVDAPVNGGIGQYRLFFTDPKYQDKAENANKAELLGQAFKDMAIVLSRCLTLHGKLCPPSMASSHEALVELFEKNFREEIQSLKLRANQNEVASSKVSLFHNKRSDASTFNERSSFLSSNQYQPSSASESITGVRLQRSNTQNSLHSNRSDNKSTHSSGYISGVVSTSQNSGGQSQFSGLTGRKSVASSAPSNRNAPKKVTALNGRW